LTDSLDIFHYLTLNNSDRSFSILNIVQVFWFCFRWSVQSPFYYYKFGLFN